MLLEKAGIDAEELHDPGTPEWMALDFDDPKKLLSCVLDSPHHTARVEAAQAAMAAASRSVAAAADWPQVAQETIALNTFRATRPWAKRAVGS